MNLNKYIFLLLFLACFFIFYAPLTATAGNFIVNFSPDPLFKSENLAPGSSISGFVEVKNTSGHAQKVVAEADNIIDSQNFSSYLNFVIKQNEEILFSDFLKNFFEGGELFLSELEDNAITIYEFIIIFDSSVADDAQGKSLENFDLLIGFLGYEKIAVTQNSGTNSGSVYENKENTKEKEEIKKIKEIEDESEPVNTVNQVNQVNQVNPVNPVNPVNLLPKQGRVAGQSDIEQQEPERGQLAKEQEQFVTEAQEQEQKQKKPIFWLYIFTAGFLFILIFLCYLIFKNKK